MAFTDIQTHGWIAGLPQSWRPYALLMRLDRPIGWWLLLLPGWWSIALAAGGLPGIAGRETYLLALFWIGAIIMRGAGCIINDLWDRDLDAKVERTRSRPLPAGRITPKQAVIFLFILLLTGLAILLQTSPACILLGFAAMIPVILYPYMKRITWWPQAFLGLTFNFGALMGWAAVTGGINLAALTLYMAGIFWTLGYDTIYAHQDREDDRIAGIKSTALLFGAHSKYWITGFYTLTVICLAATLLLTHSHPAALMTLTAPALHLFFQLRRWNISDPASALEIFRSNRTCGLLIFGICLLSGL